MEQAARRRDSRSARRSDNAARGNAGQLALAMELCGDRITIRPSGAANNLTLLVECLAGGGLPGPVVGHWAFEGEHPPTLVDKDQEKRPRGLVIGHQATLAYYAPPYIRHVPRHDLCDLLCQ